jgi:hypothetical protein
MGDLTPAMEILVIWKQKKRHNFENRYNRQSNGLTFVKYRDWIIE